MAKKIYIVSVTLEAMVIAENADQARSIANEQHAFHDDLISVYPNEYESSEARHIPNSYDTDSLIYHDLGGDITLAKAVALTGSDLLAKRQSDLPRSRPARKP